MLHVTDFKLVKILVNKTALRLLFAPTNINVEPYSMQLAMWDMFMW